MFTYLKLLTIILTTALLAPRSAGAAAATDLLITKLTNGTFTVGANAIYSLTVSNAGSASTDATITVIDDLPASLGFVSASGSGWACSAAGQAVTCTNPGPLTPGSATSIMLTVSVSNAAYPTVTNSASVSYAGDTNSANNIARRPTTVRRGRVVPTVGSGTPTIPAPPASRTSTPTFTSTPATAAATDLFLSKTLGSLFVVGANASYVLRVTNAGATATDAPITVTDTLPDSLGFVSASGTGWTCSASGQAVTCATTDPLAGGASTNNITLTVRVSSAAFPSVTNAATVIYAGDTNLANNMGRRPTTIRGQRGPVVGPATPTAAPPGVRTATPSPTSTPASAAATDLFLTKTVGSQFTVGSNANYVLTVTNAGATATNAPITVTDTLPDSLGFVSATGAGWACSANGQTVTCVTTAPVAGGALGNGITLTVSVGSAAFPSVTNSATLIYAGDTNAANNTGRRPTTIRGQRVNTAQRRTAPRRRLR